MPFEDISKALKAAEVMQRHGIPIPRERAYGLLQQCTKRQDLDCGRRLQSLMVYSRLDSIPVLADHLIRMFASCGSLAEANRAFDKVAKPSVHTWSAIITAHAKLGQGEIALQLYDRMLLAGIKSNKYVHLSVLKACTSASALCEGRHIHHQIIESGLESDTVLGNALVDMYAKCGRLEESRKVFDELPHRDVISWNAMITGYVQCCYFKLAEQCLEDMQREGIKPDVVSWGAMIAGYAQHGEGLIALDCYEKMQEDGIEPDRVTYSSILKACGSVGAINHGRFIHDQIMKTRSQPDVVMGNTLVDMYAKCGSLEDSHKVLDELPHRDVISWNAIVAGYVQCGNFKLAVRCLEDMQREGIKPDDATFTSILAACSHAGRVDELCKHIKSMREDHGIIPDTKHYTCMVHLLGHAGFFNEAEALLQTIQPDIISWLSLLTSCRSHGNVELGRRCFDGVLQLHPHSAAAFVLMSDIYCNAGMWKDAAEIDAVRQCAAAWKKPAKAWIEVNNKLHEFIVGDKSHPQSEVVYGLLKRVSSQLGEEGYIPRGSIQQLV